MTRRTQGFTLIELMIVVAIVGILAALAVPAYQSYVIRAQVAEGLSLSSGAKLAVNDYYSYSGSWPNDNAEAGLSDGDDITGVYTKHIEIEDNVIEIKFGNDAHPAIFDEKIVLTASNTDGAINWACAGDGDIEERYLPSACR